MRRSYEIKQGGNNMRNNLKRAISMLLAVVMVLGLLPAMAFAADTYTATLATGIPEGKDVAIYNASGASVFASGFSGGSIVPSAAVLENGALTVKEGAGAYRFAKNDDGTYCITLGGKYLYAIDSSNLGLSDSVVEGATRTITAEDGSEQKVHLYERTRGTEFPNAPVNASAHKAPTIAPKASVGKKMPPVTPAVFESIINIALTKNTIMRIYQTVCES
jgi:hypothetical protein